MASDSDNDAGTSIASDPGTHGPPCRIAAVATAQQREPPPPPGPAAPWGADATGLVINPNTGGLQCPPDTGRWVGSGGAAWDIRKRIPPIQEAWHYLVLAGYFHLELQA